MASEQLLNTDPGRDPESSLGERSFLEQTDQALTPTLDLDTLLQTLLTEVKDYFEAQAVSVTLLEENREHLTCWIAAGEPSEDITRLKLPSNRCICGWVLRNGEPLLLRNAYDDPRFCPDIDDQTGLRTETLLAAPMMAEGNTIGAIEAVNPAADKMSKRGLQVLSRIADRAGLGIRHAAMYQRARQAESRYESLFQESPLPMFVLDLDTKILNVNQKAAKLMAQPPEELVGSYWCDWFGDEQASCRAFFADLAETDSDSIEMTLPTPEGPRVLRIHVTRIDYGGQPAIEWIGHDITESAELERMRDDLVHMVVHDLQNPLNNIVNSLEIMQRALEERENGVSMHDVLQLGMQASRRLERLIHSLLDLRQLEAGRADLDKVSVAPGTLGREAVESVRPIIRSKEQDLTVRIPSGLPHVNADRDMIVRVLTNLLDNAAKFTQTGGRIGLSIERRDQDIVFTISDNGPGISPNAQDRAFERFTRLESARKTKGTGLGLPFCKLAVEAHGGRIWVDSTPGEGSKFRFTLPLEAR